MIASQTNGAVFAVKNVFINGRNQRGVIFADSMKGEVVYHQDDADGNPVIIDGKCVTITETGTVEIEMFPEWAYDYMQRRYLVARPH